MMNGENVVFKISDHYMQTKCTTACTVCMALQFLTKVLMYTTKACVSCAQTHFLIGLHNDLYQPVHVHTFAPSLSLSTTQKKSLQ